MSSTVKIGWLKDSNGEKFAPKTLVSQVQTKDGKSMEDWLDEATVKEIYVGDGNMPEDATVQILLDGSDEEQSFKEELKEYIDDKIGDFNADSDFVYAKQEDFEDIHEIILKPIKSAYEYAKDGGYTGTEEEFAAELANYANLGGKINEHNEASDAHQDIRNLIENIDVSNAINIHNIDESAHQDIRNLISNMAPAHTWSTEDIVAGSASTEPNGTLHLVIE